MIEVAPQIRPHLKKMKRLETAVAAVFRERRDHLGGKEPRLPKGWRPPYREEWKPVLERASLDEFSQRAGMQYYLAALLRTFGSGTGHDLTDIPFEEQVVLLTVRDLAARRDLRAKKTAKPEESAS